MESSDASSTARDRGLAPLDAEAPIPLTQDRVLGVAARARFRILRVLGEGGMGVVYEALDEERNATVALKTLRFLTADSLARFKREFRAIQDLHHRNLVQLGELIADGDRWFFTMELVVGEDLLAYVRPGVRRLARRSETRSETMPGDASFAVAPTVPFERAEGAVRAGRGFDEARLRRALHQLADALRVLHDAGMVHRDVKPSNVRVEPSGRLVLLDFGLVAESEASRSSAGHIVGTPVYMAPEQAADRAVGPEADMYAFGVVLFEALTGRAPFDGSGYEVLVGKQVRDAPRATDVAAGVPPDLDALCAALLARAPSERPSASRVLELLGRTGAAVDVAASRAVVFVGRAREIAELERARADVSRGAPVTVLVQGESGVGKTALVRRFSETLATGATPCVLSGRCYEREAVPYKAFDGVVDSLAQFLLRAPDVEALLPRRLGPLVQVFPVLRRVPAIARATTAATAMDSFELRGRAFGALRELLTRLSARYELLLTIDDVQWADADSVVLLADLLRPPDAPPLLLVATMRTSEPMALGTLTGADLEERSRELPASIPGDVRVLRVGRLTHAEARELARTILEASEHAAGANPGWIAEEADGHPLFVDVLARHASSRYAEDETPIRLEDAIVGPVLRLSPAERSIVELLSMATGPVSQDALEIASGLDAESFTKAMRAVRAARLVSTTGARGGDAAELYHDRIRVAVKQKTPRSARADLHRRLATAFEIAGTSDAQALATHWARAGDEARARRYARLAADYAADALAFERATTLYDWALQLRGHTAEERRDLYERLGDTLAATGRGAHAAEAYRKASRGLSGHRALDLRRRSAEQLLRAGHIDEGLAAMRGVLAAIGMTLPKTPLSTLLTFLFWSTVVRIRGLGFQVRSEEEIPPEALARIDACWSIAFGLSITDTIRSATFVLRSLLLALAAGETYRVVRAVSLHAGFAGATAGPRSWGYIESLTQFARTLADENGSPQASGWAETAQGTASYLSGRYRQALAHLTKAEGIWRECPGASKEADAAKMFILASLAQLGEYPELCARTPKYLREAEARGDRYGSVNLRIGFANLRWLVIDRPDEAAREIDHAMSQWTKRGVHLEHFYEMLARASVALYERRPQDALAIVDARTPGLRRALLFRVQSVRIMTRHLRARALVALAAERRGRIPELVRRAKREARALRAEPAAWASPLGSLVLATCARIEGQHEGALSLVRSALAELEDVELLAHATTARALLAAWSAGEEARENGRASLDWAKSREIANPSAFFAMLAPGADV